MAEEVAKASRQKFYNLGVEETEIQLAEELTKVCRDYCKETWMEALNLAGSLLPRSGGRLGVCTIILTFTKP